LKGPLNLKLLRASHLLNPAPTSSACRVPHARQPNLQKSFSVFFSNSFHVVHVYNTLNIERRRRDVRSPFYANSNFEHFRIDCMLKGCKRACSPAAPDRHPVPPNYRSERTRSNRPTATSVTLPLIIDIKLTTDRLHGWNTELTHTFGNGATFAIEFGVGKVVY